MGTIDYLIEEGFLKLTGPEYPTVIFGERYKEALKEQARIIMMIRRNISWAENIPDPEKGFPF